jgi:hypothetical protein
MSAKVQTVPLPESVIRRLDGIYTTLQIRTIVEGAVKNILSSTPPQRIAMMQAALPVSEAQKIYSYPVDLDQPIATRFFEYCNTMNIRPDLLIIGSMLFLMGQAKPPSDLPTFDDICGANPNFTPTASDPSTSKLT